MNSLTKLPTKSRFALLEVSDDESEEKLEVVVNEARSKCDDSKSAGKAKKKCKKKKKSRQQSNESCKTALKNKEDSDGKEVSVQSGDWDEWKKRDEQFVLSQFQRDLEEALEVSKKDAWQAKQMQDLTKTMAISHEDGEWKKKEKSAVMSLKDFQLTRSTTGKNSPKFEESSTTGLDDFLAWPNGFPVGTRESDTNSKGTAHNELVQKLLPAAHEDQLRAEMVRIKEKLFNSNLELDELRKMKTEHITMIEDLKKELLQVEKRNKQLCFILSQAEMKEKAELLTQIEELNEVKEQVVQLHAELEQERSKNSALKSEIARSLWGRQRYGSCS
ncbi:G kinase-anchoring protein 1-like isoform X4 [Stylophora pistillata]|uniref:G kinase-anchoring protein 1-like isoform X4 n=1 Tax=Stylophora pistillata TaxID=50429 RepID=UPI000C046DED|nr:G kinase-anchoring protein 1-like isoform X4 [Stylophora pistillata]